MASSNFLSHFQAQSTPTNPLTSSVHAVTINDKFDILQTILDLATTRPTYNLEIRGSHKSGRESVTDFDFNYDITQHLVREATYVVVPRSWAADYHRYPSAASASGSGSGSGPTSRSERERDPLQEIRLDVAALTTYIDEADPATPAPLSIENLVQWASGPPTLLSRRPFARGRAGISSTTDLDTAPTTQQIRALAHRIAYGGHVSCGLRAENPPCNLLSFNGVYTPASNQCLHVRSVWKFIAVPDVVAGDAAPPAVTVDGWEVLEETEILEPAAAQGKLDLVPLWELDVQQAMVCKKTDWLTDDDVALLVGLPLRALVYNLNLNLNLNSNSNLNLSGGRSDCGEAFEEIVRRRGNGNGNGNMVVDERMWWGCDEA